MNEQNQSIVIQDLAAQNADEIKGGSIGGAIYSSSSRLNHNQTTAEDEDAETEALGDLAPQEDVKGGGNQGWGKWEVNYH